MLWFCSLFIDRAFVRLHALVFELVYDLVWLGILKIVVTDVLFFKPTVSFLAKGSYEIRN